MSMGSDGFRLSTCPTCRETVSGSHYHCGGCDSVAPTSMYGHHQSICKVTGRNEGLHHCGPDGDCDRTTREGHMMNTP